MQLLQISQVRFVMMCDAQHIILQCSSYCIVGAVALSLVLMEVLCFNLRYATNLHAPDYHFSAPIFSWNRDE